MFLALSGRKCAQAIHHDLKVHLQPRSAPLTTTDVDQLPANIDSAVFSLRSGPTANMSGAGLELPGYSANKRMRNYRINRLPPDGKVQLVYEGTIASEGGKGIFNMPRAALDGNGVDLDSSSGWLPLARKLPGQP